MSWKHQLSVLVTRQTPFASVFTFVLACNLLGACTDSTEPLKLHPTVLESLTPTKLTGTVDAEVSPAPVVRVKDQRGNPMQGVSVKFDVSSDRGFLTAVVVRTDADGTATIGRWRLDRRAGSNYLRVSSEGLPEVLFTATAKPGPAASIRLWAWETGFAGDSVPLYLRVTDSFDNAVAAAPVTFEVEGGGGSIVPEMVYSNSVGEVRGLWTLGAVGHNSASASLPGVERMTFAISAIEPPAPADIRYELDSIVFGGVSRSPGFRSWIALGENGHFTTLGSGARQGNYTISGSGIVFTYSGDSPGANNSELAEESGAIRGGSIVLQRPCTEDEPCESAFWYFGKVGP